MMKGVNVTELRQKLSGVLVDFVEFARDVVVKVEQSAVNVLRSVDRCLVLAGPRFDVNDGNAGVERAEILMRSHDKNLRKTRVY